MHHCASLCIAVHHCTLLCVIVHCCASLCIIVCHCASLCVIVHRCALLCAPPSLVSTRFPPMLSRSPSCATATPLPKTHHWWRPHWWQRRVCDGRLQCGLRAEGGCTREVPLGLGGMQWVETILPCPGNGFGNYTFGGYGCLCVIPACVGWAPFRGGAACLNHT